MSISAAKDPSPAQWVVESVTTFAESVASIVPARFDAYARILHPAWVGSEDGRNVTWAEIAAVNGRTIHPEIQFPALVPYPFGDEGQPGLWDSPPDEGSLDRSIIEKLIPLLGQHTATPERCYFAYWNGWGGALRGERDRAPSFETPHREWYLYEGTLDDALIDWYGDDGFHFQSASMWWPEDHAWFVSTEVDFDSTYVGASRPTIDAIVNEPSIEALEVEIGHGITWASDTINPNPHRKD